MCSPARALTRRGPPGVQLAEGVLELLQAGKPFTRENLAQAYEARRRASWVEKEARVAEKSRDGFQRGVVTGLIGMALAAFSKGRLSLGSHPAKPANEHRVAGGVLSRQAQRRGDRQHSSKSATSAALRCTMP